MVRLILVLAPISCVLGAIGLSSTLKTYMRYLAPASGDKKKDAVSYPGQQQVAVIVVLVFTTLMVFYALHCTWVTSEAYSSPSIVLAARQHDGSQMIFDDFREAYYWLRQNTADDARIMSWWDYGYQLAAMANRTVLVDNNTWNNSHIAQVGKVRAPHPISLSLSLALVSLSFLTRPPLAVPLGYGLERRGFDRDHASARRRLRARDLWRLDRLLVGRHQQVLVDDPYRWQHRPQHQGVGLLYAQRRVRRRTRRTSRHDQLAHVQADLLPLR